MLGYPKIDPKTNIHPTRGAQEALSFAVHSMCKAGDEIIIPTPSYSAFIEKLPIFDVKPKFVPLIEEENWRLDVDALKASINERVKMIFICNPNNPTGTVLSRQDISAIANILKEKKYVSVISDECYSRILYDGTRYYSLLEDESVRDRVFTVNSFSKTFAMTGWRLGYLISGKENVEKIKKLSFEYSGGVSYALQFAGAKALDECGPFVDIMISELERRKSVMINALSRIQSVEFTPPTAGFEVFPNFGAYFRDSTEFSSRLEKEMCVETVAGVRFGPNGESHLRLVFCSEEEEKIEEGLSRIRNLLQTCKRSNSAG